LNAVPSVRVLVCCLALLAVQCGTDRRGGAPEPAESAGNASTGSTATGGVAAGGAAGAPGFGDLAFVLEPVFRENDNEAAPQVGIVEVATNRAVTGSVAVSGGGEDWRVSLEPASESHQTALIGLKPDTEYQVTVTVEGEGDELSSEPLTWRTPPLPDDFPKLELVASTPSLMEPGMTLFDDRLSHYLVVVDALGEVRWYFRNDTMTTGHLLARNGHLIFVSGKTELVEIDWRGTTVTRWFASRTAEDLTPPDDAIPVDVSVFRHTVFEMPNGNLLTLSDEVRVIDDYPTSTTDPDAPTTTADVIGDLIVELTREGELEKRISLLDLLDPTRVGRDSTGLGVQDWAHCNAAAYDPASDSYLVSSRHQDAVFKIDRTTESLVWILGNPANWREPWSDFLLTSTGDDFQWPYHQHAVQPVPGGVGLFDNGNYGAPAFAEERETTVSRAVRFAIDEEAMTVSQTFSHTPIADGEPAYANAMGDADLQPETGNTLITSGTLQTSEGRVWGQLLEVSEDTTPVFELTIRGAPDSSLPNTSTFEADRIPDIRFLEDTR